MPPVLPSYSSLSVPCLHSRSDWTPQLPTFLPPNGGVSVGEATTETGSHGQLVWTGVQTVCSHQTDLRTWLPTRNWRVKPLFPHLFFFLFPLLSPPFFSISLSLQRCTCLCVCMPCVCVCIVYVYSPIPPVSPSWPLLCLGWLAALAPPCVTRQTESWCESNYAWREACRQKDGLLKVNCDFCLYPHTYNSDYY